MPDDVRERIPYGFTTDGGRRFQMLLADPDANRYVASVVRWAIGQTDVKPPRPLIVDALRILDECQEASDA